MLELYGSTRMCHVHSCRKSDGGSMSKYHHANIELMCIGWLLNYIVGNDLIDLVVYFNWRFVFVVFQ